jgi:hypothetical protein
MRFNRVLRSRISAVLAWGCAHLQVGRPNTGPNRATVVNDVRSRQFTSYNHMRSHKTLHTDPSAAYAQHWVPIAKRKSPESAASLSTIPRFSFDAPLRQLRAVQVWRPEPPKRSEIGPPPLLRQVTRAEASRKGQTVAGSGHASAVHMPRGQPCTM